MDQLGEIESQIDADEHVFTYSENLLNVNSVIYSCD